MKETVIDNVVVVSDLPKMIIGSDEERPIVDRLNTLIEEGRDIILDLDRVGQINSIGFEWILAMHKKARPLKRRFVLCCVKPSIYRILEITQLSLVFDVKPTHEQALTSLAPSQT
jgi:anti-anti-sigma factor